LHQNPEGKRILGELLIDRFVPVQAQWYDNVKKMRLDLGQTRGPTHGSEESQK